MKGPRFITHMKRLADVEAPLANFFASGMLALGNKIGPVLWQLPPNFQFDEARCAAFFEQLPRSTAQAAEVAKGHDERMEGRALLECAVDIPIRHALEVRHASFVTERFIELARTHDIAVVCADTAGKWPMFGEVTADFAYVRLHGADELYVSGYDDKALDRWARKIRAWKTDTFVYFDNDVKVHAPFNAEGLAQRLGISSADAEV
jgi:uncharacterized protein YecE (DUF72 family)